MKWKKQVDLPDPVGVPELLRNKMATILRGTRALEVREETTPNKWLQTNRLDLANRAPALMPDDSVDDIADVIATMMHARWLEKTEDSESPESMRFRIQAIKLKEATGRSSFIYEWDPENDDVPFDDTADAHTIEAFAMMRDSLDRAIGMIGDLHDVNIKYAATQTELLAAASKMAEYGVGLAQTGMTAILQSAKMDFDREEARSKIAEETKRSERAWGRAEKIITVAAKAAGSQLGDFIKRKLGINLEVDEEDEGRARAAGADLPNDPPTHEDAPSDESQADAEAYARAHPIQTLCDVFGRSLTNKQRRALRVELGAKGYALFDVLFTVESEAEGVAAYQAIELRLDPMKLLALYQLMDASQKQILEHVAKCVGEAAAKRDAPPAPE